MRFIGELSEAARYRRPTGPLSFVPWKLYVSFRDRIYAHNKRSSSIKKINTGLVKVASVCA